MKINILSILAFASILFFGCEKTATNVDIPFEEPKIVVHSFVTSGNSVMVKLTSSAPVYNKINYQIKEIEGADVFVYDESGNSLKLTEYENGIYADSSGALNFMVGKKYKLKVVKSGFDDVTSECVISSEPNFQISNFSKNIGTDQWGNENVVFKANFTSMDNSGKDNYYRIITYGIRSYYDIRDSNYLGNYYDNSTLFKLSDGESVLLSYINYNDYDTTYRYKWLRFLVLKIDEPYYKYHKSIEDFSGESLFTEPSLVYSNITDGLGVFCSFIRKDTVIEIPL